MPTKDHFSSNWTSWVAGGKGHELVVALLGVPASLHGVADDGVFIDADQACRLADAAILLKVMEDGEGLGVRQAGAEQGSAFAFGEALLAGSADEHAAAVRAVVEADAEVVPAAQAVVRAVGVLTAEAAEGVHERGPKAYKNAVVKSCR